jgi:hypothetical protein
MMDNYVNPIKSKSLEELQEATRKRNQVEADRLCKNICLCIGWSFVLFFICYLIIFSIIMKIHEFDTNCSDKKRCEEFMIIEEYSGSEGN